MVEHVKEVILREREKERISVQKYFASMNYKKLTVPYFHYFHNSLDMLIQKQAYASYLRITVNTFI